jgi:GDPmannose 4,6-dehydratase
MTTQKTALISGITGQDGAYLTDLLLRKGYAVHGIKRRSSSLNTQRIDHIYHDPHCNGASLRMHFGDVTDSLNILRIIQEVQPDEIYNLAAQSHVRVSFEIPEYTANADGIGTLRFLEAIRILGLEKRTRFYQASTSELFGMVRETPQTEQTPFYPRSPYGVAKLYAYWITVNYREAYGIHASNGILFNHESPLRGETFVTRKITHAVARIACGQQDCLWLGNLEARRDWGHAREYVEGMWRMVQASAPDDYVLATHRTTSIREFLVMAFRHAGMEIEFSGQGEQEIACCCQTGRTVLRIDPVYYRPTEVELLIGNPAKAKAQLGWEAQIGIEELCREMVAADLRRVRQEIDARKRGHINIDAVSQGAGGFLAWAEQHLTEEEP